MALVGETRAMNVALELDGEVVSVELTAESPGSWRARVGERELNVRVLNLTPVYAVLCIDGRTVRAQLASARGEQHVALGGESYAFRTVTARSRSRAAAAHASEARVTSPMPGKVIRVLVEDGQDVTAGQGLLILEAMKMENEIRAPIAGKVKRVHVQAAQMVMPAELLVEIG